MIGWFCLIAASCTTIFFFRRWKNETTRFAQERRKFAHDLQSPIAALRALGKNTALSENERALLIQSISRLSELAGIPASTSSQATVAEISPLIELPAGREIWVIDDDVSIHQVWKSKRIERENGPTVRFFTRLGDAESALDQNPGDPIFCLVDQEFTGEKSNGFQFLAKNRGRIDGILITSHADEHELQENCAKHAIRLIAKSSLHRVLLQIPVPRGESVADAILIDDDPLVRLYWTQFAKKNGLHIEAFESASEFEARENSFPSTTRLFIDSSLGNGIRGEELSEKYAMLGFKEIYLTTGFDPDPSLMRPWIRAIFGKTPEIAWFRPTVSS